MPEILLTTTELVDGAEVVGSSVSILTSEGSAALLLATHEAAADPHAGYLTAAEGAAAFDALGSADAAQTAAEATAAAALTAHEADTTNVHGIPDTSALATDAEVTAAVAAHAAGTDVHDIAGVTGLTAALAGKADDADVAALDTRVDALEAVDPLTQTEGDARYVRTVNGTGPDAAGDVTVAGGGGAVDSVNGETGVVVLDAADVGADPAGTAAAAVTAHEAAANPHPGYLTQAEGDAAYDAIGSASAAQTAAEATAAAALSSHEADTTAVHGIPDTAALETTAGAQAKVDARVPDPAAEANDRILVVSAGALVYGDQTGGGGGSSDPTPDDPWSPASAYDYEFDAADTTSLPTGWSWVNQGTATYRERRGVGAIAKPENGGGPRPLGGIVRALPTEATWTAYAKVVNTMAGGNLQAFGLSLRESATAKTYNHFKRIGSAQPGVNWLYFSAAETLGGETALSSVGFGSTFYCAIKRNSATSYDALISEDGANWRTLSSAVNPGFTADQIGLLGWSENALPMYLSLHWFRVVTP